VTRPHADEVRVWATPVSSRWRKHNAGHSAAGVSSAAHRGVRRCRALRAAMRVIGAPLGEISMRTRCRAGARKCSRNRLYPNCAQDVPGSGPLAPGEPSTIDTMVLQIHTQPAPDRLCETCGGPSEWMSQSFIQGNGNETMARELSPWRQRCADPWCQSRRPRHRKTRASSGR
jgi:hypothetical protein